jgi:hypothetical protein
MVCQHDPERRRALDAIYCPILLAYLGGRGVNEFEANAVMHDAFVKMLGTTHSCEWTKWVTKRLAELVKGGIGEKPGKLPPGGGAAACNPRDSRSDPLLWAAFVLNGDWQ